MSYLSRLLFSALLLLLGLTACGGGGGGTSAPVVTLSSISITPTSTSIVQGSTASFVATGHYSDGSTATITTSVTWSSSNTGVATVSSSGIVTGVSAGSTSTISASLSGITSNPVVLTVTTPISLLAGNMGGLGSVDTAPGVAARFNGLGGVASDSSGNIYVADTSNHTIRKITAAGVVTTLAGKAGEWSYVDGAAADARFNVPSGVAVFEDLNSGLVYLYVADSENHVIRLISPDGVVSTPAGTATAFGFTNGDGAVAQFHSPSGVATDSAGNVYVADTLNHSIRKIVPSNPTTPSQGGTTFAVSTLAGTGFPGLVGGAGASATFDSPSGVAISEAGGIVTAVYVADTNNHAIRRINTSPSVTVDIYAGFPSPGNIDAQGTNARFNSPSGVATDSAGNVYVADSGNNSIRTIVPGGVVSTLAGTGSVGSVDGNGTSASFYSPKGLAVREDVTGVTLFVADIGNSLVRKIDPSMDVTTFSGVKAVAGSADGTGAVARFNVTGALATDCTGNVYVADSANNMIRKITPSGEVTTPVGLGAGFSSPMGVAVNCSNNDVYVADNGSNSIIRINPAGVKTSITNVASPNGVAIDSAGNVYVADTGNTRISKIATGATTATTFVSGVYSSGIATDNVGNVYVTDNTNHMIKKFTPAGIVDLTVGGNGVGKTDGVSGVAQFNGPTGIAVDGTDNIYVADTYNHTVRKITPTGVVSTLVGVAGQAGFTEGVLPGLLAYPTGVAVYGSALYITLYNGVVVVKNLP